MKSFLSVTLMISLAASPVPLFAQGPIAREAVRLASDPAFSDFSETNRQTAADWSRVLGLKPGTDVVVTVQGAQPVKRKVVLADESGLTVRDAAGPAQHERISRIDVREIRSLARGSKARTILGTIGGAAVGFVAGVYVAAGQAFKQCGKSCGDERMLIGLSLIGLPVAGGVLGYFAFRGKRAEVIYRAAGGTPGRIAEVPAV